MVPNPQRSSLCRGGGRHSAADPLAERPHRPDQRGDPAAQPADRPADRRTKPADHPPKSGAHQTVQPAGPPAQAAPGAAEPAHLRRMVPQEPGHRRLLLLGTGHSGPDRRAGGPQGQQHAGGAGLHRHPGLPGPEPGLSRGHPALQQPDRH